MTASALQPDLAGNGGFDEGLNLFVRNPVDDRAEEAFDDQLLGFGARNTTRLQVEDVLGYDLRDRRAMRAPHIVGLDLQVRNGIGPRLAAQYQIPVLLVGVGLLRAFGDL